MGWFLWNRRCLYMLQMAAALKGDAKSCHHSLVLAASHFLPDLSPRALWLSHVFAVSTHWTVKKKKKMAFTFGLISPWRHSSLTCIQLYTWKGKEHVRMKSRPANSLTSVLLANYCVRAACLLDRLFQCKDWASNTDSSTSTNFVIHWHLLRYSLIPHSHFAPPSIQQIQACVPCLGAVFWPAMTDSPVWNHHCL